MRMKLNSVKIMGYRPFKDLVAPLGPLEILVGANGAGKSSFFEFLKFLRNSVYQEIPPEIIAGSVGQQIFHMPGPERFSWSLEIDSGQPVPICYQGELTGPIGRTRVSFEKVVSRRPLGPQHDTPYVFMDFKDRVGVVQGESKKLERQEITLSRPNQLALSTMTNPNQKTLFQLREYIREWRFYSSFNINHEKIRKSVPIEQEPVLHEDAGNLSSMMHYLMTEHREAFEELELHLRAVVPGFKGLAVKARGGRGEVIAYWQEEGVDQELSLADLSDGILRLICWIVLCVQPKPPSLICIDEPDQGVHPRTLPLLAGLFEKACDRTQIFLATHASYFLVHFDLERLAVFRKVDGGAQFIKPSTSQMLKANLLEFGIDELEAMHRSDELERLPYDDATPTGHCQRF